MTKEEFIALGLTEEQATKAATASAEELKGFIPKARFDEVNTSKKKAEDDLKDRDKQLEELKKSSGDAAELTKKIESLQTENKAAKEKYETEAATLKLNTAVKLALAGKVHDPDDVTRLLDTTKIELDENGSVKAGLDDQIKGLQTSKAYLFIPEDSGAGQFQFRGTNPFESGGSGGSGGSGKDKAADFGKQIAEYAKANASTSDAQKSYFGG
ncbi:phage scaffolding protein [Paenibacillus sp. GCM10012307]|uniref:Phage scaffolding protein n=1 Tax=Paenibacillus roseus TaxID=2798579 RepID=A0A934MPY7_9BACL|nr:phage scaffolding protein [Paenibacillus roseus]MBJ6360864.1 phage scaffolding protein [Paenibacillus roseus]